MQSERIAKDEEIRSLEIARNKAVDAAEIAAREAVEAARIAQDKVLAVRTYPRRAGDAQPRIARTEVLEAAEIARRDKVERARIVTELALEKERIASAKTREVLNIDQKKAVEVAEEDRTIDGVGQACRARRCRPGAPAGRARRAPGGREDRRRARARAGGGADRAAPRDRAARSLAQAVAAGGRDRGARRGRARAHRAPTAASTRRASGANANCASSKSHASSVVESAMMDKAIAIYQKSLEQSAAQVEAENARARATEAEERVRTVRESEVAKRRRTVEVMIAEKEAEEKRIAAEAERVRAAVEAEAQTLLNEAENVLTDQARYSLFRRRLLDKIEGIVRESVKPMEKIEGIRILHVDGLAGGGGGGSSRNATDEVINSALRYRVQAPLIELDPVRIGMEGGSLSKLPGLIREARDLQGIKESYRARREGGRRRRQAAREAGGRSGRGKPGGGSSGGRAERKPDGARLHIERHQRPQRPGVGAHPRLQRIAELASGDRRKPHRERRAGRQDRLRARLPPAQRRPHPRAAARSLRPRPVLHLFDPRIADGGGELRRDLAADAGHRRRAHLRRMDRRVRLRAGARGGAGQRISAPACSRAASTALKRAFGG